MRALSLTFNLIAGCLCILFSAVPIYLFLCLVILELCAGSGGASRTILLVSFIFSLIGVVAAVFSFVFSIKNFRSLRTGKNAGNVIPFQIIILILNSIQYAAFYFFFCTVCFFDEAVGKVAVGSAGFISVLAFIFGILSYEKFKKSISVNNRW